MQRKDRAERHMEPEKISEPWGAPKGVEQSLQRKDSLTHRMERMEGTGREGSLGETAAVGTVPEALGLISNSDTYNEKRMSKEAFHSHRDSETNGNQLSFSSPGQNHE